MEEIFKFILDSRNAFVKLLDGVSIEELNHIPEGYNNNMIWNFGHIVVSTQALCYLRTRLSQNPQSIKYYQQYKSGTYPESKVLENEFSELKEIALQSIIDIKRDYDAGIFGSMPPFTTETYSSEIQNINELLITTAGHDNLHFGYAWAIKKRVLV
ncbi:MAG: DinB family protein [Acinetobacter sp.]|nr:MAG: DinB family protein [Acinetobacter sp.]